MIGITRQSFFLYSNFLVNSADRIVRVYDVDDIVHNADSGSEPEALQKLQDLVNKYVYIHVYYVL